MVPSRDGQTRSPAVADKLSTSVNSTIF